MMRWLLNETMARFPLITPPPRPKVSAGRPRPWAHVDNFLVWIRADQRISGGVRPRVTLGGAGRRRASPKGNSRQAAVVRTLSQVTTSIRLAALRWIAGGFKPRATDVRPEGGDPMQVRRGGGDPGGGNTPTP